MRKLAVALFINILMFGVTVNANQVLEVPETTLHIARNAGYSKIVTAPSSKIVRVGIGQNNFTSYEWDSAEIYANAKIDVFSNNEYLKSFESGTIIKLVRIGQEFILSTGGAEVLKVPSPVRFKSDFGLLGIRNLKRAGRDAVYRGQLEIVPCTKNGKFHIVNVIPVEEYLKGVVPNEMPVSFGLEALKAQAVAARNYVLSPRVKANPNYDVVDSVASQVYFGANTEKDLSNQAVSETSGIVALYGWDLILAQYSSTAGGYTESFANAFSDPKTKKFPSDSKPYLIAKPDYPNFKSLDTDEAAAEFYKSRPESFDVNSRYYRWEREWTASEFQSQIQANIAAQSATGFITPTVKVGETIGEIQAINVLRRGESGKIIELEIQTDNCNYIVQKELVIRRLFKHQGKALPSANLVFEQKYDESGKLDSIKAYGGGFGHGVGMSQYGAGFMANELGKSFDEILKHYYSDIILATEPEILSSMVSQIKTVKRFWTKNGKANLVVDNKYGLEYLDAVINGYDEKIVLDISERYNVIDISKYLQKGENTVTLVYPVEQGAKAVKLYIELVSDYDNNEN
ncbi:MAG: SpoIID/LytB domain-containing protein [Cyanobacteria bacterium SIG26]|nr:SpoIID/LytB domain-containing protein [Cyanobacteria bacterium SIG26]